MQMVRVIYDLKGKILLTQQGTNVYTPQGVPYMDVQLEDGSYIESMDTSISPHRPVIKITPDPYGDIKQQIQSCIDQLAQTRQANMATTLTLMQALAEVYEQMIAIKASLPGGGF
ncbi:hypothetical protein [Ruminiclostridium josui]|uniref:hypothetical protein n=1 Tax=Ruminiclostridium josui TaxID=1499 RepID=UPI00054F67A5|nr:hypothetical protein [Ruminiclostridium josui]